MTPTCEHSARLWIAFWMKRTSDFQSRQAAWDLMSSMHAWVATTKDLIARRFGCSSGRLARLRRSQRPPSAAMTGSTDALFSPRFARSCSMPENFSAGLTTPQIHCDAAAEAIFDLVIRHAENLAPVLPAIESRLAKLSDYLAAGAACV